MFRWLKKKCNRPSSPRFTRYYTSRNSWITEDDYSSEPIPPLPRLDLQVTQEHGHDVTSDVQVTQEDGYDVISDEMTHENGYDVISDTENGYDVISDDHIYEDIGDFVVTSAIDQLTEAISGLTARLERDFGERSLETESKVDEPVYSQVRKNKKAGHQITDIQALLTQEIKNKKVEHQATESQEIFTQDEDRDDHVYAEVHRNGGHVRESEDVALSPRTKNSRDKCRAWLKQQEGEKWDASTDDTQIAWSSQEDVTFAKPRRPSRLSRQSSMADRREMLRRIRDTWFDSSDDSSDTSDNNRSYEWSSCSSENCMVIQYQRASYIDTASSGEDTSGFYDDSHTSPKSSLSSDNVYSESYQSPLSSSSGDSLFTRKRISGSKKESDEYLYNPRIGFGLNRWYKP